MQLLNVCAGLILMALLMALPVWPALFTKEHWKRRAKFSWLDLALSELGAVLVTYDYPVVGTTAPTAAQLNPVQGIANAVTGTAYFGADTDTTALITTPFALATTGPGAKTFPIITFYVSAQGGTGTVIPVLSATVAPNLCVISKTNLANTSCTVTFAIFRPNSLTI